MAPGQRSLDDRIEMAQKADGFEIFAAAVDIGNPFARRAAVVAIEHGCDGIDAQPVDVKMLKPIERAGDQEALHFAAAEIVDVGIPVVMEAFARIEVLVKRCAVETGQAMRVGWKMRRHPIEDDADIPAPCSASIKREQTFWRTIARTRREQTERLIAPGSAERMFGDRQKLDMGKAHFDEIGHKPLDREIPQRAGLRAAIGFSQDPR